MNDIDWLESLKPGDKVIVKGNWDNGVVSVVDRVTPTGRVVVGGIQYRKGCHYDRVSRSFRTLREATPEATRRVHELSFTSRVRSAMSCMSTVNLTYEQAVAVNEIFGFVGMKE